MRPLELTIEGFKSYRQAETFGFEDRGLFGIVGPTGAGKSTILEALLFGFFGKTPRVERDTKKLINTEEQEAKVHLLFEVQDQMWSITRVIRRKGASQVVLDNQSGSGEQVTGDKNANERVAQILGLDFAAFCASISLPQGEFDRFLRATPKQRTEILKGLFRLQRVDELRYSAKGRFGLIRAQIEMLQKDLDALPADAEKLLGAARDSLKGAIEKADRIAEELPLIRQAEQELDRSAGRLSTVQQYQNKTVQVMQRIPGEAILDELIAKRQSTDRRQQLAEEVLRLASVALRNANEQLHVIETQGRGEQWCSTVEAAVKERDRLDKELAGLTESARNLEKELDDLKASRKEQQRSFEIAERHMVNAKAALIKMHEAHAAHLLRSGLQAGQACPVCRQTVSEVPDVHRVESLEAAADLAAASESAYSSARDRLEASKQKYALVKDRYESALDRLRLVDPMFRSVDDELRHLIPGGAAPAKEVERARLDLQMAKSAVRDALAAQERAAIEERSSRVKSDELAGQSMALSATLANICGQLGVDSAVVETEGLVAAAKLAKEAGQAAIEDAKRETLELEQIAAASQAKIQSFRTRFGAGAGDQAADVFARAKTEVAQLEFSVQQLQAAISKRVEAEAQVAELAVERSLYERLIADLTDSKFTAYLLEEQRRLLSRLASEKFLELTGHYVFSDDGEFEVVDQRTGATRTAETLSGGETFLASLSLALALAEAVGQEGGRLGCFFLDEGFGSLDAESLDLALEGIEALAVPGRLIGLISHVGGIQSRLDDLIVLERNDDGSTSVAQHEGPIGYAPAII